MAPTTATASNGVHFSKSQSYGRPLTLVRTVENRDREGAHWPRRILACFGTGVPQLTQSLTHQAQGKREPRRQQGRVLHATFVFLGSRKSLLPSMDAAMKRPSPRIAACCKGSGPSFGHELVLCKHVASQMKAKRGSNTPQTLNAKNGS